MTTSSSRRLSPASEYETLFGVRHRPPGRPSRDDDEPLFPRGDVDDLLGRVAERRAYAVIHEKYRDELGAIYRSELKVLERRGVEEVREDVGRAVGKALQSGKRLRDAALVGAEAVV